jgi:steroid delta-isomerase-like uncharacterized protein
VPRKEKTHVGREQGSGGRFIEEVWNEGKPGTIDEFVHPDFVDHDPAGLEQTRGPKGVRRFVEAYRAAFPDVHMTVEDQIAEGDRVATRWTAHATHRGELMGVHPSGNRVEIAAISIDRISGGKFVESWTIYDALGMMQQIDANPAPERSEQPSPT